MKNAKKHVSTEIPMEKASQPMDDSTRSHGNPNPAEPEKSSKILSTFRVGQEIGRYHILEQIGEGGMATVFKAFDTQLERDVALKVIHPDFVRSEDFLKRFEREAKLIARLTHPNIVSEIDYGVFENVPYMVMEYVQGGTLKEKLGKPIPWREAARLLAPIARALEAAHRQKIVHRDVKPANILLAQTGEAMLSDFGIARMLETDEMMGLTRPGVGMGTPEYMAPEQALGKGVDHRADIYALGVVFYEMVTGRTPYQADTPLAVLIKKASEPLPRPGQFLQNIPEVVEKVLFKALAKDPADRYQDAGAFAEALERLAQGKPVEEPQRLIKWGGWAILGGLVVLVALGVAFGVGPLAGLATHASTAIRTLSPSSTVMPVHSPISTFTLPPANDIGSTWVRPTDGMVMVPVPASEFLMGSTDSDTMANNEEKPQHNVLLDAYWIDKTEVTNIKYAMCVHAGSCQAPSSMNSSTRSSYYYDQKYADYPVIFVNWYDAESYCKWAGSRLPTEAEWEKAARGTDGWIYPWGNGSPSVSFLNYNSNVGDTIIVGNYPPGASPYGALDMAGNVWEWVNDWYDPTYYANSPSSNPTGRIWGYYRVLRGGGWDSKESLVRSAYRNRDDPGNSGTNSGFRCASSVNP